MKEYGQQFKFNTVLEAIEEFKTIHEIAGTCDDHPTWVKSWKNYLLAEGPTVFG